MTETFTGLAVDLKLESQTFDRGLRNSTRSLDQWERQTQQTTAKVEKNFARVGESWSNAAAVVKGGAFAAGLLVAVKGAAELEQSVGGASSVFKDQAGKIEAFSKTAANAVGLSQQQALQLTTLLGASLKGYGYSLDEASTKSIELVRIGADLAATFGGSTADAVESVSSALRAEYDRLEKYGIALNQTMIDQKAVSMGLATSTGNVDQHARAQAALAMIIERSKDAHGQFGREANTASGAMERAKAAALDAAAGFASSLLPVVAQGATGVTALTRGFGQLPPAVQMSAVGMAALVAFRGPLGQLADAGRGVLTQFAAQEQIVTRSHLKMVGLGVAVTGVAFAYELMKQKQAESDQAIAGMFGGAKKAGAGDGVEQTIARMGRLRDQIQSIRADEADSNSFAFWDADWRRDMDAAAEAAQQYDVELSRVVIQSKNLAAAMDINIDEANKWISKQLSLGRAFNSSQEAIDAYVAETGRAADAAGRQAQEAKKQADAMDKVSAAFFGLVDASQSVETAHRKVEEAQQAQADAGREVVDAERAYEEAVHGVAEAERSRQAAVRQVNEAHRSAAAAVRNVEDAEQRRADSLRKVEDAQLAVVDAQRRLNEALAGPTNDDQISLERGQIALARARKRMSEIRTPGASGYSMDKLDHQSAALDIRAAEADLARLRDEISRRPAEAAAALRTAQDQLLTAARESEQTLQGIADAKQGYVDAMLGIADANHGVAEAARARRDAEREAQDAMAEIGEAKQAFVDAGKDVDKAKDDWIRALVGVEEKQRAMNTAMTEGKGGAEALIKQLEGFKQLYPDLAAAIDPYLEKLKTIAELSKASAPPPMSDADRDKRALEDLQKLGFDTSAQHWLPGAGMTILKNMARYRGHQVPDDITLEELEKLLGIPRRMGGPLTPGVPYLFGEDGPETAVFSQPGYMLDAQRTADLVAAGGSSRPVVNVSSGGGMDRDDMRRAFAAALREHDAEQRSEASYRRNVDGGGGTTVVVDTGASRLTGRQR